LCFEALWLLWVISVLRFVVLSIRVSGVVFELSFCLIFLTPCGIIPCPFASVYILRFGWLAGLASPRSSTLFAHGLFFTTQKRPFCRLNFFSGYLFGMLSVQFANPLLSFRLGTFYWTILACLDVFLTRGFSSIGACLWISLPPSSVTTKELGAIVAFF